MENPEVISNSGESTCCLQKGVTSSKTLSVGKHPYSDRRLLAPKETAEAAYKDEAACKLGIGPKEDRELREKEHEQQQPLILGAQQHEEEQTTENTFALADMVRSTKGLVSSELFLPMLAELFVALFRARCFSSLVCRVLRAVEDEIIVDESFRPYQVLPYRALKEHSCGLGSTLDNSCSCSEERGSRCEHSRSISRSSGSRANESSRCTGDGTSGTRDDSSTTGIGSRSNSDDLRRAANTRSDNVVGDTSNIEGNVSTPGTAAEGHKRETFERSNVPHVGVREDKTDIKASQRCARGSARRLPASTETEKEDCRRLKSGSTCASSSTPVAANATEVGPQLSNETKKSLAQGVAEAGATFEEAVGGVQQMQRGSANTSFTPALPLLFRRDSSRWGSDVAISEGRGGHSSAATLSEGPSRLQGVFTLHRQLPCGDGEGRGWCRGASSSDCRSLSRGSGSFSIAGGWERLIGSPVGAQVTAGIAADMSLMPFFTKLNLVEAFTRMDKTLNLTKRKVVPPSFNECRMLVNLAQLLVSKSHLCLITFDGDETLYPDGGNFEDKVIAEKIAALLQRGTAVAVVTAAGYGYDTERYEERLGLLLSVLKQKSLDAEALGHFYVIGAESNYFMRLSSDAKLERLPEELWFGYRPQPCPAAAEELLNVAEAALRKLSAEFRLPASILRKPRGVGLIKCDSGATTSPDVPSPLTYDEMHRENLEEVVVRVRRTLTEKFRHIPWSAFNGGKDVWVDVGNKAEGVAILQGMLQLAPAECLHVGDQFHATGNDVAARVCSPAVWISNPQETAAVLQELLTAA